MTENQRSEIKTLNSLMKLRQNGTVSFLIRLADFQARGVAHMKLPYPELASAAAKGSTL